MGLIGIKIRIARKEKIVHEFTLNTKQDSALKDDGEEIATNENKEKIIAKTESEQIKIEVEKMKSIETLEEEEAKMK